MHADIVKLKDDPNPMLKIKGSGVNLITPQIMEALERYCMERFKTAKHQEKGSWHRLSTYAKFLHENGSCPESGQSVIGPFITDNIKFPTPGEIVSFHAGIKVYSTLPQFSGKVHHESESRKVRVHDVTAGFLNFQGGGEVVDPMIHWELKGGFTAWSSIRNVEEAGITMDFGREKLAKYGS